MTDDTERLWALAAQIFPEHFETKSQKGRGKAKKSIELIDAMFEIAEAAQPITGRGVGYKLFINVHSRNAQGLPAAQGSEGERDNSLALDC